MTLRSGHEAGALKGYHYGTQGFGCQAQRPIHMCPESRITLTMVVRGCGHQAGSLSQDRSLVLHTAEGLNSVLSLSIKDWLWAAKLSKVSGRLFFPEEKLMLPEDGSPLPSAPGLIRGSGLSSSVSHCWCLMPVWFIVFFT